MSAKVIRLCERQYRIGDSMFIWQCTSYESEIASYWMCAWLNYKHLILPLVVQGMNERERTPPEYEQDT